MIICAGNNETFKFYFDLNADTIESDKVFIFDESSMISNVFSEQEFFRFGSGFLLNDIIKRFNLTSPINTKLIFVGDPAQLPPVGSAKSLALEEDYFEENYGCDSFELTEVVRQRDGSGILENAKYYRKLIFSDIVSENNLNTKFDDIEEIDIIDLTNKFTDIAPTPDYSKAIIITYSNALAYSYNKLIREYYFTGQNSIVASDILQIVKNNYSNQQVELLNGDFVKVMWVGDTVETQSARIKKKNGNDVVISHYFRRIGLKTYGGNDVEIMILDSHLNSKNRDLSSDETKALYINFIMRYEERIGRKANKSSKEFKEAFKSDPYYNALHAKYGYAITGHKSQGGEWENAFVDFTGRIGTYNDALRWNYTAITRASKKLFVLHPPKLKQVDFSKIKDVAIGKVKSAPKKSIIYPDVEATPFHTKECHPAKRLKYFELKEVLEKEGYEIESIISKDYLEKYIIRTNDSRLYFELTHNGEGVFTQFKSLQQSELSDNILQLISKTRPWNFNYEYSSNDKFLNKIYQNVLSAIQDLQIQIIRIDDSRKIDFHVTYYFRTDAQIAYLQIYFNKKEIVSNIIAKSMLGEEDFVLRKFIVNLKG